MNQSFSIATLILRLGFGGLLLTHGFGKFMKLVSGDTSFANPLGIGEFPSLILTVFAEFICPIAIIIGWKTKLATIPPIVVMLVALFVVHASDPMKVKELALIYLVGFISIYLLGSGKYALDVKK